MPTIELFKGNDSRRENPQNWLQKLEGSKFKHDTPDDQKIHTFSKYLDFGSKADIWYKTELTPNDKVTWPALEAAFNRKWPPVARSVPSMEELQTKLYEMKLTEEELGQKIGDSEDDQMWSHVDWALRVQTFAEDIGDDKGMLIPIARTNLPIALGTLLPNDISTWQIFTDGVRGVSLSRLSGEADRERNIEAVTSAVANLTITPPTPNARYGTVPNAIPRLPTHTDQTTGNATR